MCAASNVTEQDQSLIALTTHLAQVQFRLRQVISATDNDKEVMLKQLDEFVSQGCHGDIADMQFELPSSSSQDWCFTGSELSLTDINNSADQVPTQRYSSDDSEDHVAPVTIDTESCHPQTTGNHGDYIDYVKNAEQEVEPLLPLVTSQPIRIDGFGSADMNLQCSDDDKQPSYLVQQILRLLSLLKCGCGVTYHQGLSHVPTCPTSQDLCSLSRAIDKISMLVRMTELDHVTPVKLATIEIELHTAVTMEMADSLLLLLSDGILVTQVGIVSKLLFGDQQSYRSSPRHHSSPCQHEVWSLLKAYYHDKHQATHPTQSLACAFDLPMSEKTSPKKTLSHVIQLMDKYYEQQPEGPQCDELKFRCLICKGFNLKHLSSWTQLLANHTKLLKSSYSSNSFALQTEFRPIIAQLGRLNRLSSAPEVSLPDELPVLAHQYCIT